jgi:hypothetical protein
MTKTPTIRDLSLLATLIAVGLIAAACGTSSHHKAVADGQANAVAPTLTTTATSPLSVYAAKYSAIIAPANAYAGMLPTNPSAAQLTTLAAADSAADNQLLRVAWPTPAITADVKAMVSADGAEIGDLQRNNDSALAADQGKAVAAANIVRTDLGLPPVSQ